jgi:hypothetical protein
VHCKPEATQAWARLNSKVARRVYTFVSLAAKRYPLKSRSEKLQMLKDMLNEARSNMEVVDNSDDDDADADEVSLIACLCFASAVQLAAYIVFMF